MQRHVAELNQEMLISVNQYWGRHRSEIEDQPEARLEDIDWADGIAFGTPTRFGNVAARSSSCSSTSRASSGSREG